MMNAMKPITAILAPFNQGFPFPDRPMKNPVRNSMLKASPIDISAANWI